MTGGGWLDGLRALVAKHGAAVRVVVAEVEGSTPREAGAAMVVLPDRTIGTIGGGELEHQAIAHARGLLDATAEPWHRVLWSVPLGPALGQCCGGRVTLLAELFAPRQTTSSTDSPAELSESRDLAGGVAVSTAQQGPGSLRSRASAGGSEVGGAALVVRPVSSVVPPTMVHRRKTPGPWPARVQRVVDDMLSGARPLETVLVRTGRDGTPWLVEPAGAARTPVMLYGAGHVGRALVRVLQDLPFDVTWVDTTEERFPATIPPGVERRVASDPALVALEAPAGAWHLVMTYSHPLDLAICHAVLQQADAGYLGLIGSASKRARFVNRLVALGHAPEHIGRHLHCPIGLPDLPGKAPAVIAVSVAADLVRRRAAAEAVAATLRSEAG